MNIFLLFKYRFSHKYCSATAKVGHVVFSFFFLFNHSVISYFFATPWIAACQASLSTTISLTFLKFMSTESWCHQTISSSVVAFSCLLSSQYQDPFQSVILRIRWPKYQSFSLTISPSNEYSGLITECNEFNNVCWNRVT